MKTIATTRLVNALDTFLDDHDSEPHLWKLGFSAAIQQIEINAQRRRLRQEHVTELIGQLDRYLDGKLREPQPWKSGVSAAIQRVEIVTRAEFAKAA